jgi:hypothetical protein
MKHRHRRPHHRQIERRRQIRNILLVIGFAALLGYFLFQLLE